MAALSDTPTPPMLTSEVNVSIKLEQGVLSENDYGSVYHNTERQGNLNIKYDSNHPPATMENGSSNSNLYIVPDKSFESNIEIKSEPPVDIEDAYNEEDSEEYNSFNSYTQPSPDKHGLGTLSPLIRLTPTCKLISTTATGDATKKKRYECPYEHCTKSYGKSSHLRSHLTWHTGIKPFVCQEADCGKGFTRSDELNRHIRTHTGEKPFECVQCTKKFSRSDHLTKHLAVHSKQLAANVKAENKRIRLAKKFSPPVSTEAAEIDEVSAPVSTEESQHADVSSFVISSINENVETSEEFSDGTHFMAGFMENTIKRRRSTTENLTDNLEVSRGEHIKIKLERPENTDEYQVIHPPEIQSQVEQHQKEETLTAGTPLITSVLSETHLKAAEFSVKHEPTNESELSIKSELQIENEPDDDAIMPEANLPPFQSSVSVESLMSPFNPVVGTVYDPSRPFPCSQCPKCFKRQDDLNRHMRTHTGEKPFACNECEKRFMRSDHLKKHLNTHTRVR